MTGSEIYELFENCFAGFNNRSKSVIISRLQVSNIKAKIDLSKPKHSRITLISINNTNVDLESNYKVITTAFLADGGDNFITKRSFIELSNSITDTVKEYINWIKILNPQIGRLSFIQQ
jgi:2',3'-cyclic-nucleotide 2'-phosphodiesterase (5'-nucleotidase family)